MLGPRYGAHRTLFTWNDDQVTPLALRTVRLLTLVAFGGYAVSRLLERLFPETILDHLLANLLSFAAAVSLILVLSSRLQRLFTEKEARLDEYQRLRRNEALTRAYAYLSGVAIFSGIYIYLGVDFGWPLPSSRDTLGDLGFGLVLLACLLPVTILAWSLDLSEDPEAPEAHRS